jgi:hypothetical protein
MADPIPPTAKSESGTDYRPISGLAIAGFVASLLFGLLILASAGVALVKGTPFFFPSYMLLLAIAGIVLALLALRQIRDSEGTRDGASLARFTLWFSLVTGLGYFAYYYVTGLALINQANTFLLELKPESGFFPNLVKMHQDKTSLYGAFLLTVAPTSRAARPDDERSMLETYDQPSGDGTPGLLTQFQDHPVIRAFTKTGADKTTVVPLGVQNWNYEQRSYKVVRNYRVSTPELEMDLLVPVQSSEGESAGEGRKWFVALPQVGVTSPMKHTEAGQKLKGLRMSSRNWIDKWVRSLNEGKKDDDYAKHQQTDWSRLIVSREADRKAIPPKLEALFKSDAKERLIVQVIPTSDVGGWEIVDGKLQFSHAFKLPVIGDSKQMPEFVLEGKMVVESLTPVTLDQLPAELEWRLAHLSVLRSKSGDKIKGPG